MREKIRNKDKRPLDIAGVVVQGKWLSNSDFDKILSKRDFKILVE